MKITIYELLGMIKDGKAPKKVKWGNNIYTYVYDDDREENIINYYYSEEKSCHLIDGGQHDIRLNDEVEIIEEEKKIPEKLNFKHKEFEDDVVKLEYKNQTLNLGNVVLKISDTIDEIIDYLKSKGE